MAMVGQRGRGELLERANHHSTYTKPDDTNFIRLKTELSQQKTAKGFLNLIYFECGSNHDFGQKNSGPYFVFLDFLSPDQVGSLLSKDARTKRYCRKCINKVLQLQNSHYGRRVLKTLNYV